MGKTMALGFATALGLTCGFQANGFAQGAPRPQPEDLKYTAPVPETMVEPTCKGFLARNQRTYLLTLGDDGSVFTQSSTYTRSTGQHHTAVSKHCKGKAWTTNVPHARLVAATDSAGALYYAAPGTRVQGQEQETGAVVGKLSPSGSKAWETRLDPRWKVTNSDLVLEVSPDKKTVYMAAISEVQLPRHPPEHRGSRFIAAFDQKGQMLWFKQSKDFGRGFPPEGFTVDSSNHLYLLRHGKLLKLSPEGVVQWSLDVAGRRNQVVLSDRFLYVVGETPSAAPEGGVVILKIGVDGKPVWSKQYGLVEKVTIDPVEGTEWLGRSFPPGPTEPPLAAALHDNVLLVPTKYGNNYSLGFDPPPSHWDVLFVGISPNDGTLVGTHQYRTGKHFQPMLARALRDGRFTVVGLKNDLNAANAVAITVRPSTKMKPAEKLAK